jgi:hypothetical protein
MLSSAVDTNIAAACHVQALVFKMKAAIIVAGLLLMVAPSTCLNVATYNTIVTKINAMLNLPSNIQPAPLHAKFVRLTFHDCTGPNGCDGCINLNLQDNKGLEVAVSQLEGFYNGEQIYLLHAPLNTMTISTKATAHLHPCIVQRDEVTHPHCLPASQVFR